MIPKILPEKKDSLGISLYSNEGAKQRGYIEGYNNSIDDCQSALEKAVEDGVVCVCPSEEELTSVLKESELFKQSNYVGRDSREYSTDKLSGTERLAKSILNLFKEKK